MVEVRDWLSVELLGVAQIKLKYDLDHEWICLRSWHMTSREVVGAVENCCLGLVRSKQIFRFRSAVVNFKRRSNLGRTV